MVKSNSALSRFKSQDSALRSPGSCITCKGITGPFIDPGVQFFPYGSVYICVNCVREMSDNLGFFETEPVEPVKTDLKAVEEVVNSYVGANSGLLDALLAANAVVVDLLSKVVPEGENSTDAGSAALSDAASKQGASGISSDSSDELSESILGEFGESGEGL